MIGCQHYLKYLEVEGADYEELSNCYVCKFDNISLFIIKRDSEMLQLMTTLPVQGMERSLALDLCNQVTDNTFMVKCIASDVEHLQLRLDFLPSSRTAVDEYRTATVILLEATENLAKMLYAD